MTDHPFHLGQPVNATGHLTKTRHNPKNPKTGNPDYSRTLVTYTITPTTRTGVIAGSRVLRDYTVHIPTNPEDPAYADPTGEPLRVYLVAYSMGRRPLLVPARHVHPLPDPDQDPLPGL